MGDDPNKLDEFISKYESKKDETDESNYYESPISSFINGLKKKISHLPRTRYLFPRAQDLLKETTTNSSLSNVLYTEELI